MQYNSDLVNPVKAEVLPSSDGKSSSKQEPLLKVVEANLREEGHLTHISECCKRFHKMSPWADTEYDHGKVMSIVVDLIVDPNGVVLIHESGFLLGKIEELVFGRQKVAYELAWWAETQGTSLLKSFEDWSRKKSVSGIIMASLFYEDQDNKRYNRLFAKAGFVPRETFWFKEL